MKKFKFLFLSCILMITCLSSCEKTPIIDEETDNFYFETWVVASKQIEWDENTCFWIKRNDNPVWMLFYDSITGLDYKKGYEYVISVKIIPVQNPPQDASSAKYVLDKIISMEEKESDTPFLTQELSNCSIVEQGNYVMDSHDYFIQGDMILNIEQASSLNTKSGCITDKTKYWPNNIVYYQFRDDFMLQNNVQAAISEWESKTSLTFVNSKGYGNYIEFFHGDGNYSYLGMQGGKQEISLSLWGSNTGSAIHEIGHAIGLIHEQCRTDRDNYIIIYPENIYEDKLHNFDIYPSAIDIGTFDFGSIMLYSSNAFSHNGLPSMTTKDGLYIVGQRTKLSDGDIEGISAIYGPPFHKLNLNQQVIIDEINGQNETFEYVMTYTINIYADKNCTQPIALTYPRPVTIYVNTRIYSPTTNKINETVSSYNITIPAGSTTYTIGSVHNIERYFMSNPIEYNVTTYSITPERTLLQ